MSLIYLVALFAVSLALLGALVDAVCSVSRRPVWRNVRPSLTVMATVERRARSLPSFVGAERRLAAKSDPRDEVERVAA